ncbi:hypothetical protein GQ600_4885 [Phytophthora cactorum]|nr:hypothetical protein GQ600_4885 [Phytophthora cactorum]
MFQKKVPNGGNVPGVEAIGHERAGGGPNNDFGLDFIEAMFKWTKTFCEKDSDGDGQTNGQELGDPPEAVGEHCLRADAVEPEVVVVAEPEATEAEAAEPEAAEEKEVEEKKKDAVMQAAVHSTQYEAGTQQEKELTAGTPALHASVMLSAMQAFIGTIAAFAAFSAPQASGYSMYAMRVPNGDKVPGVTALGHLDPVLAGPMNEFGMDMIDADFHWTKEFCMKDSDGDGQTNGQELGDPCCEFVFRKSPKSVDTAVKIANASVKAGEEPKTEASAVKAEETATETAVQAETVTEDTEESVKVSSQKTEGANETAEEEEAAAVQIQTAGVSSGLFSSSLLSAAVVLGLLVFVVMRMRRRRSQWTLLPQQGRRTQ